MRIYTDASVRPSSLPLVPLLQAIGCQRNEHDDWWERHAPGGDVGVAAAHQLVDDPAHADAVVIPLDWYWVRGTSWASMPDRGLARRLAGLAATGSALGLPVVVFFSGDRSCDRVWLTDALVFREGGYRSKSTRWDRPMPALVDDLAVVHLGGPRILPRPDRPTVGFCGLAGRRIRFADRCRELAALTTSLVHNRAVHPSQFLGETLRAEAIELLAQHPGIETGFVVRSTSVYFAWAAAPGVRREFVENMAAHAYSLCIRGSGNYSYRLYETLAMGRIPVIVDTDLDLPRADVVPWGELAVWVREDELEHLGDAIEQFHRRLSGDDFVELQHLARRSWVDHLRPQAWLAALESDVIAPAGAPWV